MIKVNIDEKIREKRLIKRDGIIKTHNTAKSTLSYKYLLTVQMEEYADKIFLNKGNY